MALLGPKETVTLNVTGMTCGNCVRHVTDALKGVDGVRKAAVDLDAAKAEVTYDPEQAKPGDLVAAVKASGYDAALPEGAESA